MNLKNTDPSKVLLRVMLFVMWWVVFPLIRLTTSPRPSDIIMIILSPMPLCMLMSTLLEMAEPYELDCLKRDWCIIRYACPDAVTIAVFILGYVLVNMAIIIVRSGELSALSVLMGGAILIVLSCFRWQDTLRWRSDIEKFKIPDIGWL
jgi:hypothetical protein